MEAFWIAAGVAVVVVGLALLLNAARRSLRRAAALAGGDRIGNPPGRDPSDRPVSYQPGDGRPAGPDAEDMTTEHAIRREDQPFHGRAR